MLYVCSELVCRNMTVMSQSMGMIKNSVVPKKSEKETIHSGHFMVSHFEAEAQDDEDVLVPVPEDDSRVSPSQECGNSGNITGYDVSVTGSVSQNKQHLPIETSLTKLFQCMSLAYRQKLTSPKWNRFKGIRLRWKDKIRLNNVIWRCWHMQFVAKQSTLVCQFASPLDVDTHNKPEAIVLEGKYWKRKLHAVTAEYKKWRMFYRTRILGWAPRDGQDTLSDIGLLEWQPHSNDSNMMVDEDYMEFMTDTLFSTITANQPFAFPDTREIARGASLADFIQPSLVQLQPNLDDFMDTLEPLQELLCTKLPPVPEECPPNNTIATEELYRSLGNSFFNLAQQDSQPAKSHSPPRSMPSYQPSYPKLSAPPSQQYNYQYSPPPPPPPPSSYQPKSTIHNRQIGNYSVYSMPPAPPSSPPQSTYILPDQPPPPPPPLPPPPQPPPSYSVSPPRMPTRSLSLPLTSKISLPTRRDDVFAVPKLKSSNRSRSGSCLVPATNKQPPPLLTTASDPVLSAPSSTHSTSALLAHLLTTSSVGYSNSAYGGSEHEKLAGPVDATYNYTKQNHQSEHYHDADKINSRSVIYPNQSDIGSLNLSPNRSLPERLGSQLQNNHLQSVQVLSNENNRSAFAFNTGPANRQDSKHVPILPHPSSSPSATALLITSLPQSQGNPSQVIGSASNSPKHPDSPSASESLSLSPLNVGSPGSSTPQSPHTPGKRGTYKEHRRVCHINAEQKRRCNIKNGFDTLHALIPQLNQNPNAKLSKAAMLQKGAEYIRQLRNERNQLKEEMDNLRQQVESLNSAISNCQSLLPATGAPVSRHRTSKMKEMFDEYVRVRTQENWKFWILSLVCEPLLLSFNAQVSTHSIDDLYRTTLQWVEHHCSLLDLRPVVLNALRHLCTSTDILADPSRLPAEARAASNKAASRQSIS